MEHHAMNLVCSIHLMNVDDDYLLIDILIDSVGVLTSK